MQHLPQNSSAGSTLASSSYSSPTPSLPIHSTSGSGKDFVLFDESTATPSLYTPADLASHTSQPSQPSRPAFTDKPSFTQYRGPDGPASIAAPDSPFASPPTRALDDFPGPSSVGSHGSGTLSPATGVPNRKRQRGNHARSGSAGGSSVTHSDPTQSRRASTRDTANSQHSSNLSSSIPGLADSTADDWTLADTSPQEPSSGSFGPAIDSLSLGSGSEGTHSQQDLFPSLFPELGNESSVNAFDSFPPQQTSQPDQPLGTSPLAQTYNGLPSNMATSTMLPPDPQPMQTDPTPAQEAIARQQVRLDLQGVDQRALRGPLRALAQQGPPTPLDQKVSQAQVESALKAAVDSFVAEADANRQTLNNARAPGQGGGSNLSQDQRNLLFPGGSAAFEQPPHSSNQQGAFTGPAKPPPRPSVGPRRRSSSFDASFLPAPRPWFSQSPPQPSDAPNLSSALDPTVTGLPGGTGMGTGTGWIDQPTNTFNAFDLGGVGVAPSISNVPQRRALTRDRSGLTISPQETFLNFPTDTQALMASVAAWQNGLSQGTTQPSIAAQTNKPILTRGETVRPSLQQQQQQQHQQGPFKQQQLAAMAPPSAPTSIPLGAMSKPKTMTAASSASSGLSLISPASSDTNDDEDERPFRPYRQPPTSTMDHDAPIKQQQQQGLNGSQMPSWPPQLQNQNALQRVNRETTDGPRFFASSSSGSSSEEEDDSQQRVFPSHRAQSGSNAFLNGLPMPPLTTASRRTSSSTEGSSSGPDTFQQPLGRGRGLQGGYGYMPGSAESGLQVDTSNGGAMPSAFSNGGNVSAFDSSSQQSQDEDRVSPSIRSTAQVIGSHPSQQVPLSANAFVQGAPYTAVAGRPGHAKAAYGGYPLPAATSVSPPQPRAGKQQRQRAATSSSGGSFSASSDDGLDAAARSDTGDSDYEVEAGRSGATSGGRRTNKSSGGANVTRKSSIGKGQSPSTGPMYGHSLQSSGVSHHGSLTVCEYVSPLSGARCGTEFHRPYDLARHRETIHAKEEASLIRQGKLTKEQCRVLYVEVDPQRSQATQEWKCDGKNGCGSVFSRKDALQRHKRLRNH